MALKFLFSFTYLPRSPFFVTRSLPIQKFCVPNCGPNSVSPPKNVFVFALFFFSEFVELLKALFLFWRWQQFHIPFFAGVAPSPNTDDFPLRFGSPLPWKLRPILIVFWTSFFSTIDAHPLFAFCKVFDFLRAPPFSSLTNRGFPRLENFL